MFALSCPRPRPLRTFCWGERGNLKYLNNRVAEDWNGHFPAGRFLNNLFSTVHRRYAFCIYTVRGSSIPRDGSIGGINQPSMFMSLHRACVFVSSILLFSFFLSLFFPWIFNDAIKIHRYTRTYTRARRVR